MIQSFLLGILIVSPLKGRHFRPSTAHTQPRALQGRLRHSKRSSYPVNPLSANPRLDAILDWSQMVVLRSNRLRQLVELLLSRGDPVPAHPNNYRDKPVLTHIQGPLVFSQLGQARVGDRA